MAWSWPALAALALGAGCAPEASSVAGGEGAGGAGGAATGGAGGVASGGAGGVASGGAGGGAGAASGGEGGAPFVCDPPAEPGSLYEATAESMNIEIQDPISMCQYRGDVLLIVNTAAL